jgi:hypothetical protein
MTEARVGKRMTPPCSEDLLFEFIEEEAKDGWTFEVCYIGGQRPFVCHARRLGTRTRNIDESSYTMHDAFWNALVEIDCEPHKDGSPKSHHQAHPSLPDGPFGPQCPVCDTPVPPILVSGTAARAQQYRQSKGD